jgi:hypothetical protein
MTRLSLLIGALTLVSCDNTGPACKMDSECPSGICKDGHCTAPPVIDLAQCFSCPDLAQIVGQPTCVPPGMVECLSGETFYSSPTSSGCFHTGSKPPNANPDPGYDNPSGPCPNTDNVIACDTPPSCSFCLTKTAAIPPGCYAM